MGASTRPAVLPHPSAFRTARHTAGRIAARPHAMTHPDATPLKASAREGSLECTSITSLRDLPQWKGALLDQFGVLHDGKTPYPGAIEGVQYLHQQGLKLLVLSNSSRRAHGALDNLNRMGFPREAFHGVITSGEVTHDMLLRRPTPFWAARRTCIHITWAARGAISLENLDIDVTQDPNAADFILAHGTEAVGVHPSGEGAQERSLEDIRALLLRCAALNNPPPMVVANPDIVTVHGAELRTMPGTLARWYAEAGGQVHLMGKPAPIIYEVALRMLGLAPEEVVAIGDSLEHDIAGAAAAGVQSVFVSGGIHAADLQGQGSDALEQLCRRYGARPSYVLPSFTL